jgi:hypothetical protein
MGWPRRDREREREERDRETERQRDREIGDRERDREWGGERPPLFQMVLKPTLTHGKGRTK